MNLISSDRRSKDVGVHSIVKHELELGYSWSARGLPEYQFAGSPARVYLAVLRPQRETSA